MAKKETTDWLHIYPLNDLKKHFTGAKFLKDEPGAPWWKVHSFTRDHEPIYVTEICECLPWVDFEGMMIIHNAWDCREALEEAERILKSTSKKK